MLEFICSLTQLNQTVLRICGNVLLKPLSPMRKEQLVQALTTINASSFHLSALASAPTLCDVVMECTAFSLSLVATPSSLQC